ncbi:MAG: fibronectin type III domain-containing protein [Thermoflexales bacterium]|nr:fibronectin type III domain-containing protein [Thermoflexales bacterium]
MNHTTRLTIRLSLTSLVLAAVLIGTLGGGSRVANAQRGTGVVRVSPNGQNINTCGSAELPCKTLAYGVKRAYTTDTVLVAQGVYTFDATTTPPIPCSDSGITSAVLCVNGKSLTILGGYSGSDWTTSNPARYPTIIDGQNAYRGVSFQNGTYRLEGFTIQNGRAQGAGSGSSYQIDAYGAGLIATLSPVTLRNLVFKNNQAQGGNTNQDAGGCAVGGAISLLNYNASQPYNNTLENIQFDSNLAQGGTGVQRGGNAIGGAVHTYSVIVTGNNLTFTNNIASSGSSNGSGESPSYLYADAQGAAGAFYIDSVIDFQNVTATNNQTLGGDAPNGMGGGAFGGAFYLEHVTMTLRDSVVRDNLAQAGDGKNATGGGSLAEGGGIQSDDSAITLNTVSVIHNIARGGNGTVYRGPAGGGGVAVTGIERHDALGTISNSIIADNRVEQGTSGQLWGGGGGGLWLQGMTVNVLHSTIARNWVATSLVGSGALVIGPYATVPGATVNLQYNIFANHTTGNGALYVQSGSTANLTRGLWSENALNTNAAGYQPGIINGLSTMVSGLAKFVSPGSPNYDYHIQGTSDARNNATGSANLVDVDYESRLVFAPADIGADEYVPFVLAVAPSGDGQLYVTWETSDLIATSAHHYIVTVTPEAGATPPNGGTTLNASGSYLVLTGLTNGKTYSVKIQAYTSSNTLIDSSNVLTAKPLEQRIVLPTVMR